MINVSYLQRPLLKPALYLMALAVMFVLMFVQLDGLLTEMEQQLQVERNKLSSLYREVRDTSDKLAIMARYSAQFKELEAKSVIGKQPRADWIDRFMALINRHGVVNASIQFSARSPLSKQQLSVAINEQIMSQEQIEFVGNFQHELDFINFMNALDIQVHELSLVHGCQLRMTSSNEQKTISEFHFDANDGNIVAKCLFNFTVVAPIPLSSKVK